MSQTDNNDNDIAIITDRSIDEKIKDFSNLLTQIESLNDKKRQLWKEIYENALVDRENAAMLFTDAWSRMSAGTAEHVTLGPTLTKYMERMSKSNEQILRLAELISKIQENDEKIDPDDVFASISGD